MSDFEVTATSAASTPPDECSVSFSGLKVDERPFVTVRIPIDDPRASQILRVLFSDRTNEERSKQLEYETSFHLANPK